MSYILDALKKADRERHLARVPTLGTVHSPAAAPRRRLWPWLVSAVLVANAALAAALILRSPAPVSVAHSRTPVESGVAVDSSPAPTAAPVSPAAPAPTSAALGVGQAPRGRVEQAPDVRAAETSPAPATAALPERTPAPSVAPAPAPRPAQAEPAQRPEPVPRPTPERSEAVTQEQPPAATGRPAAPAAPRPAEPVTPAPPPSSPAPSPETAAAPASIPKMKLDVLVYSDIPAERMVFINGSKYVQGQRVDGKFLVEEITPEGPILSYQGQRSLLRQ
jgi:general secretion pathway protein B